MAARGQTGAARKQKGTVLAQTGGRKAGRIPAGKRPVPSAALATGGQPNGSVGAAPSGAAAQGRQS